MRFLFVLNSQYPTKKAYGITTGYTADALVKENQDVTVLAFSRAISDHFGTKIISANSNFKIIQKVVGAVPERIRYYLRGLLVTITIRKTLKSVQAPVVIWVRDFYLFVLIRITFPRNLILFENHRQLGKTQNYFLKYLLAKRNSLITGITAGHVPQLLITNRDRASLVLPMCAPNDFFEIGLNRKSIKVDEKLRVCYVGKATSSGNSNGLEFLLQQINIVNLQEMNVEFTMIGIEPEFIRDFAALRDSLGIEERVLRFLPHASHQEVLTVLKNSDVGLVPYPNSSYNSMRFPIKIVEYAAAGVLILAAKTPAHSKILPGEIALFYDDSELNSLAESLRHIASNQKAVEKRLARGLAWSQNYRYSSRVHSALTIMERKGWLSD
jgi:glycosyltransferase involved in cell wall biosynthesis